MILSLLMCLSLFALGTSCTRDDDVEEIFAVRVWYMNGATVNGMKLNNEIKNFYTTAGEQAYYISFQTETFTGMLSSGAMFAGTWTANGKEQTISLNITSTPATSSTFDKQLYHILSRVGHYSSGSDFLQLGSDDSNIIMFGSSRSRIYN